MIDSIQRVFAATIAGTSSAVQVTACIVIVSLWKLGTTSAGSRWVRTIIASGTSEDISPIRRA